MGYGGGTGGCDHCVIYSPYLQRIFPAAEYPQYYDFSYTASLSDVDHGALNYLVDGCGITGGAAGVDEHSIPVGTEPTVRDGRDVLKWCEKLPMVHDKAAFVLHIRAPYGSGYCVPFSTTGDGNCLTHAVSRGIFGVEMWFAELRSRMVIELEDNREWYTANIAKADGLDAAGAREAFNEYLLQAKSGMENDVADGEEFFEDGPPRALRLVRHAREASSRRVLRRPMREEDLLHGTDGYLSFVHVIALAHVVGRPIMVMDNGVQMAKFGFGTGGTWGTFVPSRYVTEIKYFHQQLQISNPDNHKKICSLLTMYIGNAAAKIRDPHTKTPYRGKNEPQPRFQTRHPKVVSTIGVPLINIPAVHEMLLSLGFAVTELDSNQFYEIPDPGDDAVSRERIANRLMEAVGVLSESVDRTGAVRPLILSWTRAARDHFVPLVPVAGLDPPVLRVLPTTPQMEDPFCDIATIERMIGPEAWSPTHIRAADWVTGAFSKLLRESDRREMSRPQHIETPKGLGDFATDAMLAEGRDALARLKNSETGRGMLAAMKAAGLPVEMLDDGGDTGGAAGAGGADVTRLPESTVVVTPVDDEEKDDVGAAGPTKPSDASGKPPLAAASSSTAARDVRAPAASGASAASGSDGPAAVDGGSVTTTHPPSAASSGRLSHKGAAGAKKSAPQTVAMPLPASLTDEELMKLADEGFPGHGGGTIDVAQVEALLALAQELVKQPSASAMPTAGGGDRSGTGRDSDSP